MNIRIDNVRIISEDTFQLLKSKLDILSSVNDSLCAEIESTHKLKRASEFLTPFEHQLEADGEDYPLVHNHVSMNDIEFLKTLNVRY